jgi:hypothetical protein
MDKNIKKMVYKTGIDKNSDNYTTFKSDWESIAHFIPKDKVIWEPFYCDGTSGKYLTELGFNVIHKNEDFFQNNHGDIIVSNPPFSNRKQILQKIVELDKPFILIVPIETIQAQYYLDLFANNNDKPQIIIPKKRMNFTKIVSSSSSIKQSSMIVCVFLCWKMNLEQDITYLSTKPKLKINITKK